MNDQRLYTILAFAGAVPFVAAAVLLLLGYDTFGRLGDVSHLAQSYGLAIACFLAGAHWALYLGREHAIRPNLFLASNVVVLGVWIPYLLAPGGIAIVALLIAFLFLLYVDLRLLGLAIIDARYFRMRLVVTAIVCASLVVVLLAI